MVLQDLGDTPPPDDFGGDPSSNHNLPSGRRFDESQMPFPFPVLGPIVGYSAPVIRYRTEQTIKFAEQRIHRSLTPVESQALAIHLYKMEQTKSYYAITGASAGIYRAYSTMSKNRYPFYKPKPEDINPNKFLFIRGPYAQIARHFWRFTLYTFVATEMGKLVGQIVSQSLTAEATASDPLLTQFADDLRSSGRGNAQSGHDIRGAQRDENGNEILGAQRGRGTQGTQELPPHAGAPKPWGRWPQQKTEPKSAPSSDSYDDMSPTAGNDGWSYPNADSFGDSNSNPSPRTPQDDSQSQSQTSQQGQRRGPPNPWNRQASRPVDQGPGTDFLRDEEKTEAIPGESAWDRLRRESVTTNDRSRPSRANPGNQDQRDNVTRGDSFTFDDDRQTAQEKAQREFDERLERERQGKYFNDNHKRW